MITKQITKSITKSITKAITILPTRFFTTLDSAVSAHYVINDVLEFEAGDTFKIDFLAPTSVVGGTEYVFDDDGPNRAHLQFEISGNIGVGSKISDVKVDGVTASVYPIDGKLHTLEATFSTTATIGFLATRNNIVNRYNGILANAVGTTSGVTTTFLLNSKGVTTEAAQEQGNTNYITYENIASDDTELFTLTDGSWIGEELVVNGGFTSDSDWTKGDGWSIGSGAASSDGTQTGSSNLSQAGILTVGDTVLINTTLSNYTAGQVSLSAGAIPRFAITSGGGHQTTQVVNSQSTFYAIADVDFIGSVDNVSVKRKISIA